jgi:hypothetical protein
MGMKNAPDEIQAKMKEPECKLENLPSIPSIGVPCSQNLASPYARVGELVIDAGNRIFA